MKVNLKEFRTNLSKYIRVLEKGEESEIIICRANKRIAKLTLIGQEPKKDLIGCGDKKLKGKKFELKKGFEDIAESFTN